MRLVGNDVVDLDEPHNRDAHLRPRWVERVCAPPERAQLARSASPRSALWSLFAAKEAAYKVVCKLMPERPVFAHRRFAVGPELRWVQFGGLALGLEVKVEGACVHAVAWLGAPPALVAVEPVPPGENASRVVRRALLSRFCDGQVTLERLPAPGSWDGYGPPRLRRAGQPLGMDLSLSHDGRYAAFALSEQPPPPITFLAERGTTSPVP